MERKELKFKKPLFNNKWISYYPETSLLIPLTTGTPVRQRARTVGSVGGESMKRELARRRLTRLKEETQLQETETTDTQDPSPRMTIFNKTAVKGTSPVSSASVRSSSRQQIFQVTWSYFKYPH